MSVPPEVGQTVRRWIEKAEHDLEAATRILQDEHGCPYDTACFHCQQAVEKYLKAALTFYGVQADDSLDPSGSEAHEVIAAARSIRAEVRSLLPSEILT